MGRPNNCAINPLNLLCIHAQTNKSATWIEAELLAAFA